MNQVESNLRIEDFSLLEASLAMRSLSLSLSEILQVRSCGIMVCLDNFLCHSVSNWARTSKVLTLHKANILPSDPSTDNSSSPGLLQKYSKAYIKSQPEAGIPNLNRCTRKIIFKPLSCWTHGNCFLHEF